MARKNKIRKKRVKNLELFFTLIGLLGVDYGSYFIG